MKLNIIEIEEHDMSGKDTRRFKMDDGTYNTDYYPYLQLFGRPDTNASAQELKSLVPGKTERLAARSIGKVFQKVAGKIYKGLTEAAPSVWTQHEMGRAEYDYKPEAFCLGTLEYIAAAMATEKMTTAVVDVEANCNVAVREDFVSKYGAMKSTRARWEEAGVPLPDAIPAKVYIIAPKNKIDTACDMMKKVAAMAQEPGNHCGFHLSESIAYQSLTDDQKNLLKEKNVGGCDNVAWYEIHQGVFFTIDPDMYQKVKLLYGLELKKPEKTSAPKGG